jgi:beta-carotene hydroxylase
MRAKDLPLFDVLGRDLLVIHPVRRARSLVMPFALVIAFFVLAEYGRWAEAIASAMLLTFLTYGSISHDLVHRTLRLPPAVNEGFLCAIELLSLRSGHAYRLVHLHHHAQFPATDDLEGAAAGMTWWRALLDGVTLQPRLWAFAFRRGGRDRLWIGGEVFVVVVVLVASIVAARWTIAPALFAALMIAGSWLFPFITSFIPHDPKGETALTQTRLFRGRVLSLVALEHLYHLEHHLYPQVPHHNWPELGRRLDPYFARAGLRPVRIFF